MRITYSDTALNGRVIDYDLHSENYDSDIPPWELREWIEHCHETGDIYEVDPSCR